jgi:hypothetical protein
VATERNNTRYQVSLGVTTNVDPRPLLYQRKVKARRWNRAHVTTMLRVFGSFSLRSVATVLARNWGRCCVAVSFWWQEKVRRRVSPSRGIAAPGKIWNSILIRFASNCTSIPTFFFKGCKLTCSTKISRSLFCGGCCVGCMLKLGIKFIACVLSSITH